MTTNASSVFNNSVLLSNICDYSDNNTIISLLQTSRLAFNVAAPRVWRSLDNFKPLLMLLASTLELVKVSPYENVMKATLPTFNPNVFTRFKCYNSFVHKVEFSNTWLSNRSKHASLELQPWSTLSLQAQHDPLLPNLRDLHFSGLLRHSQRDQILLWMSTFISPSVDTLSISTNFEFGLTQQLAAGVFSLLTQKAPRLKKLAHDLTIQPPRREDGDQPTLSSVACSHLRTLPHLAHLAIKSQFIDSAVFSELSRLPKLEYLSIRQDFRFSKALINVFESARLPLESFPALQTLQLNSDTPDDMVAAWNVAPLVSGLTAVSLQYYLIQPLGPAKTIYDDNVLRLILPPISKSSPHLTHLTLGSTYGDKKALSGLQHSPWTHLGHLPLSRVTLRQVRVSPASLVNVQHVWPRLVILELPEQQLTLQHFVHLSQLPKLEILSAAGLEHLEERTPKTPAYGGSPLRKIELNSGLEHQVRIKSIGQVAYFLLELWPDFQRIEYTNKFKGQEQPYLDFLNMHIRVFQGVAESKRRISTQYGADAALSLLDARLSCF